LSYNGKLAVSRKLKQKVVFPGVGVILRLVPLSHKVAVDGFATAAVAQPCVASGKWIIENE
jgi:hypothetical protein